MGKRPRKSFMKRFHQSDRDIQRDTIINLIENELMAYQYDDREPNYDDLKQYDRYMWDEEEWNEYFDRQKQEQVKTLKKEKKEEIREKARIAAEEEYYQDRKNKHREILRERGNKKIESDAVIDAYSAEMSQSFANGFLSATVIGIGLSVLVFMINRK